MLKIALLLLLMISSSAWTGIAERWSKEKTQPQDLLSLKLWMSQRQVVFVSGIFGELSSRYFQDNVACIKERIGHKDVFAFFPRTSHPTEVNAQWLKEKIEDLYKKNGKPFIIIGHSKGGTDSLAMALMYNELLTKKIVEKIVLIQSPVLGSPAASWAQQNYSTLYKLWEEGLNSLIEEKMRKHLGELWDKLSPKQQKFTKKRIYFIRSEKRPEDMELALRYLARKLPSPNDGAIPTANMLNAKWGRDLGIVYADHLDLVTGVKYGWFHNYAADRCAFTRALLFEIAGINREP